MRNNDTTVCWAEAGMPRSILSEQRLRIYRSEQQVGFSAHPLRASPSIWGLPLGNPSHWTLEELPVPLL